MLWRLCFSWSTAPLASSKSKRAADMPSLALKVDRSITLEAASEIDPWQMPSWPKATFSSLATWMAFSHGWESILPWATLGSAIFRVSLSSTLILVMYDPNCWKWVGHTRSTFLMDNPFRSPLCSMIAVRSTATDYVTGNLSPLEEATVFVIHMGKADGGGGCTHTHSPWSTIYALTCLAHTSRLVHEDS